MKLFELFNLKDFLLSLKTSCASRFQDWYTQTPPQLHSLASPLYTLSEEVAKTYPITPFQVVKVFKTFLEEIKDAKDVHAIEIILAKQTNINRQVLTTLIERLNYEALLTVQADFTTYLRTTPLPDPYFVPLQQRPPSWFLGGKYSSLRTLPPRPKIHSNGQIVRVVDEMVEEEKKQEKDRDTRSNRRMSQIVKQERREQERLRASTPIPGAEQEGQEGNESPTFSPILPDPFSRTSAPVRGISTNGGSKVLFTRPVQEYELSCSDSGPPTLKPIIPESQSPHKPTHTQTPSKFPLPPPFHLPRRRGCSLAEMFKLQKQSAQELADIERQNSENTVARPPKLGRLAHTTHSNSTGNHQRNRSQSHPPAAFRRVSP